MSAFGVSAKSYSKKRTAMLATFVVFGCCGVWFWFGGFEFFADEFYPYAV